MSRIFMPFTLVPRFHFSHFQSPHCKSISGLGVSASLHNVWNLLSSSEPVSKSLDLFDVAGRGLHTRICDRFKTLGVYISSYSRRLTSINIHTPRRDLKASRRLKLNMDVVDYRLLLRKSPRSVWLFSGQRTLRRLSSAPNSTGRPKVVSLKCQQIVLKPADEARFCRLIGWL